MKSHFLFFLLASTLWLQDVVWSTPVPGVGGSRVSRISKQKPSRKATSTGLTSLKKANGIQQVTARPLVAVPNISKNKANFGTTVQLSKGKKSTKVAKTSNVAKGTKVAKSTKKGSTQTAKKPIAKPSTTAKGKKSKGPKQHVVTRPKTNVRFRHKSLPFKLPQKDVPFINSPTSDYVVQDKTGKGTVTLSLASIKACLQQGAKINNLNPRFPGHGRMSIGAGRNLYPTEMHTRNQPLPGFLPAPQGPQELLLHHPIHGPDYKITPHDRPHTGEPGPHRCFFSVTNGQYRFLGVGIHYGAQNNGYTEGKPCDIIHQQARWPSGLRRQTQVNEYDSSTPPLPNHQVRRILVSKEACAERQLLSALTSLFLSAPPRSSPRNLDIREIRLRSG
ncbi:hypothetical protein MCOR02_000931 [Pyricularia oryzae]|nr:hypothetical protein MCOR02_000931 [Pyricularia oryzae]